MSTDGVVTFLFTAGHLYVYLYGTHHRFSMNVGAHFVNGVKVLLVGAVICVPGAA